MADDLLRLLSTMIKEAVREGVLEALRERPLVAPHEPVPQRPERQQTEEERLHERPAGALFTSAEAAKYLGFKFGSMEVMRCRRAGAKWIKVGRLVRYRKADLDDYLRLRAASTAPPDAP